MNKRVTKLSAVQPTTCLFPRTSAHPSIQNSSIGSIGLSALRASLSGSFPQTLPELHGYATEGALFIFAQQSTDAVSALRKVWVLILKKKGKKVDATWRRSTHVNRRCVRQKKCFNSRR